MNISFLVNCINNTKICLKLFCMKHALYYDVLYSPGLFLYKKVHRKGSKMFFFFLFCFFLSEIGYIYIYIYIYTYI